MVPKSRKSTDPGLIRTMPNWITSESRTIHSRFTVTDPAEWFPWQMETPKGPSWQATKREHLIIFGTDENTRPSPASELCLSASCRNRSSAPASGAHLTTC